MTSRRQHSRRPAHRWQWFSVEVAPVGVHGPFGPFTARSFGEAQRIAEARAASSGLTLDRIAEVER